MTQVGYDARRELLKTLQRCVCCDDTQIDWFSDITPRGFQVDHVIPLAIGGAHCGKNLQVLPKREHFEKNSRDNVKIVFTKHTARLLRNWPTLSPQKS